MGIEMPKEWEGYIWVECPTCKGTGDLAGWPPPMPGEPADSPHRAGPVALGCPECWGNGEVPVVKEVE
jgi:hypothetical protein